ncbi:achaete-scute homolog 1-like [Heptranchias perlo]|uniref:achaete-scute homolog 1-like n=1 Tax=Heptranchias perlo TaxID=212740 RepID=UPI00355A13B4
MELPDMTLALVVAEGEPGAGGHGDAQSGRKGRERSTALPQYRQGRGAGGSPSRPAGCGSNFPNSTARRNERERNRVKLVNLGFANLKRHVPQRGPSKRMSKVDTLRSAVEYIRGLEVLLREQGSGGSDRFPSSAADRGSLSDSPPSSYSSEDTSCDSLYSEQEFTAYKDWLGIE